MDKIDKFLVKLIAKQRKEIEDIVTNILKGDLDGLNHKKLKGFANIFRVRKGNIRIQYQRREGDNLPIILDIQYRNEKTYRL